MESMGVASGCGCKVLYRFPYITYPYSSCIGSFLSIYIYTGIAIMFQVDRHGINVLKLMFLLVSKYPPIVIFRNTNNFFKRIIIIITIIIYSNIMRTIIYQQYNKHNTINNIYRRLPNR